MFILSEPALWLQQQEQLSSLSKMTYEAHVFAPMIVNVVNVPFYKKLSHHFALSYINAYCHLHFQANLEVEEIVIFVFKQFMK